MEFLIAISIFIVVVAGLVLVGAGWLIVLFIRGLSVGVSSSRSRLWVWVPLLFLAAGTLVLLFYEGGMGILEQFPLLTILLLSILVSTTLGAGAVHVRRRKIALVVSLAHQSAEVRDTAAAQLRHGGADVVRELTRAASDRGFAGRVRAVHLLGEAADPLSADDRLFLFHRQADDTEPPEVRAAAKAALAALLHRAATIGQRETPAFRIGAAFAALRRRISPRRFDQTGADRELTGGRLTPQRTYPELFRNPARAEGDLAVPPPLQLPHTTFSAAARVTADRVSKVAGVGDSLRTRPPPLPRIVEAVAAKPTAAVGSPPAGPPDAGMHRVFVSHSSHDSEMGHVICSTLERSQIRCWIAPRDIPPGAAWGEAIIDGINGSRVMIVVLSRHSNDSPQVLREVERAVSKKIVVIAFRIDDIPLAPGLEYFLSAAQWLNAVVPPLGPHLVRLEAAVVAARGATPVHSATQQAVR